MYEMKYAGGGVLWLWPVGKAKIMIVWYIYKPPNDKVPYRTRGDDFSYITPDTPGHWQSSDRHLMANSMLHHTLSPIYRPTYVDYLAVVKYDRRNPNRLDQGTSVFGVLMADEMGGVWISHTVPGFPDLSKDRLTFPQNESANGHMFVCLSLDLVTLNKIGATLKQTVPNFVNIKIPRTIKPHVPDWNYLKQPSYQLLRGAKLTKNIDFNTRGNTLRATILIRKPGETHCLYKTFAKEKHIVLDIYGHRDLKKPICEKDFSVRNIDVISLKSSDDVRYIKNKTDRSGFAVSTAAHWQQVGSVPGQFWACVNSLDNSSGKGALIMCVEDYNVWLSFDNFKIKEPDC